MYLMTLNHCTEKVKRLNCRIIFLQNVLVLIEKRKWHSDFFLYIRTLDIVNTILYYFKFTLIFDEIVKTNMFIMSKIIRFINLTKQHLTGQVMPSQENKLKQPNVRKLS